MGRVPSISSAVVLAILASPAPGQDPSFDAVKLRVTSVSGDGLVVVDRGTSDRVDKGDLVVLRLRDGSTQRGLVHEVLDRTALVRLHDRTVKPDPGTPGEVLVPASRQLPGVKTKPGEAPPGQEPQEPVFTNKDEGYKAGMPLLAGVRPVRPEERNTLASGRVFAIGVLSETDRTGSDESYFRAGTDMLVENPFGHGGGIRFDAEYDIRTELNDVRGHDLLLRQMSYYLGGTRFQNRRVEIGRFIQSGMPEFQTLDGIEYGQRLDNNDRYGLSVGFLPEPDDDFDSGEDLQLAGYYDWVHGDREELTLSAGVQKTWHNGHSDRDLFLGKLRYLPLQGWDFQGSMWVDYYDGKEQYKSAGIEVTQVIASAGRRFQDGSGLDLTYRRVRHPDILRWEFRPLDPQYRGGDRYDRLSLASWLQASRDTRLHSVVVGWDDEASTGGAFEVGVEQQDVWSKSSRADLTVFANTGNFLTIGGARLDFGQFVEGGRWDAMYEIGFHHYQGFPPDRDDLLQHRVRASRAWYFDPSWDMNLHLEGVFYDTDVSVQLGFYVQRSF